MKTHIYVFIAALGTLFATSCSNEDLPAPGSGADSGVTFKITLPAEIQSRYGEGEVVKKLQFAVYETPAEGEALGSPVLYSGDGVVAEPATSATDFTLCLHLVKGRSYDFIFWADAATESPYTFDPNTQTVSMNYASTEAGNEENRDAFFQAVKGLVVSGTMMTQPIELRRPFAQLNIGTSDLTQLEATGTTVDNVAVTVTGVRDALNLYTGVASGEQTVTFSAAAPLPTDPFPYTAEGVTYQYLSMNYLLTGEVPDTADVQQAQRETMDVAMTVTYSDTKTADISVPSVPVQRNYRTNIFGSLLTSAVDLNIVVSPGFFNDGGEDINISWPWDGKTTEAPEVDENGNYVVKKASQLAGLLNMVNSDGETLSDKTVVLGNDIDLNNQTWASIGTGSKQFSGTFDGQGHKIVGLTSALFNYVNNANVKHVSVETNSTYTGLIRQTRGDVNITGVTVNGTVSKGNALGKLGCAGLVSYAAAGNLTIDSCVNNATIADNAYVGGGFVGRTSGKVTIKNSKNYGKVSSTRYSEGKAAGFIGMPAAPTTIENCTNYADITVNTSKNGAAGGFVAWVGDSLTVTGCSNEGNINYTINNSNGISVVGGIFGGVGYSNAAKTFTGCSNSGTITVTVNGNTQNTEYQYGVYAGAILGSVQYGSLSVTDCTAGGSINVVTTGENAQTQYIGGLVGGLGWETALTVTGNTISSDIQLTGNQGENTIISPLYYNITPNNPADPVVDNNTNNSSYQ